MKKQKITKGGINSRLKKLLLAAIVLTVGLGLSAWPYGTTTQTRYLRSDDHTIYGISAKQLKVDNSVTGAEFTYSQGFTPTMYRLYSKVFIVASNGTISLTLAEQAGYFEYAQEGPLMGQGEWWSCPGCALSPGDVIMIDTYVGLKSPGGVWYDYGPVRHITEPLGFSKLNSSTWTFYRWYRYQEGAITFYFGGWITGVSPPTIDSRIDSMSLSYEDTDIGLRIETNSGIQTIACEPAGTLTSPLRIRKGATTYGIGLVETTAADASTIGIKTSTGTKALARH